MIKTEAKTCVSQAEQLQYRVNQAVEDLKTRKEHGESDIIDTYEFGFISALKMMDTIYHLNIDFGEEN